ncbi:major capsid protein [Aeromicrobium sp. 9AM]|uniref:major capsid protein n=1 Tax=Aeromicrobium sp. 9AM TaxID=2653126 RepID=UPI0012F19BF4|nr:phage capsid protein [Aeromicrobium sp. 9AM]VXB82268.1 Phage capsid protein [Aeromicrobium sp. 9AM]
MPVTLAQAMQNAQTDYDAAVIDEFRTNPILDLITFDDAVNPAGGGGTLTYGYRRLVTAPTAEFRAVNSEYSPTEVTTQQFTTDLKVLGGAYQIDRVLAKIGPAASAEVALQSSQKIKAAKALFGDAVINGDSAVNADSFDGLKKALTGSSTEDTTTYDWSGTMDQAKAFFVLTTVDDLLAQLDGEAGALISNKKVIQLIKAAMRFANMYTTRVGPRDTTIVEYNGAVLVDAGFKAGSASDVVPITAKKSALYAVRFGLDAFHGVSTVGGSVVSAYLPDFTSAGAVKTGEVELGPVGVALKATKAAAVDTAIQVVP